MSRFPFPGSTCAILLTTFLGAPAVSHGDVFYAAPFRDNGPLYTFDSNAGYAVQTVGEYGIGAERIGGLTFDAGGTLYGMTIGSNASLYTLDPATGTATLVGPLTIPVSEGGLAIDPTDGKCYCAYGPNNTLLSVDLSTGEAAIIGPIDDGSRSYNGIAFDAGGQLYAVDNSHLWKIDKNDPSGPGTMPIGPGISLSGREAGMAYSSSGVMYVCDYQNLFSVDLSDGTQTLVDPLNGAPNLMGLAIAPDAPIPVEPATWSRIKTLME